MGVRLWRTPGDTLSSDWLGGMLNRLAFCQNPLWPSRWMSAGLLAAAKGEWSQQSGYYLMYLSANAGLAYLLAAVVARDLYRRGYSRVQGGRSSRRRHGLLFLDAVLHRLFLFLPRPIRLLILKDLRTFLRDPAQWSQFLIFFGLLGFYFLNIPRLGYGVQTPYWRNLVSFLNLSVTALILSTFTSRFIFPLLSLEGRNFWVLGLLPLPREQILWGKFVFSAGISLVATEVLVVLSDLMLRMSPVMIVLHVGMIAVLCLGLSGISVGLGARLPNLRETDPSKIAAGFGGTLNLLVSLVFIFAIVTALALALPPLFRRPGTSRDGEHRPVPRRLPLLALRGHRRQPDRGHPGHPGAAADRDQGVSEDGVLTSAGGKPGFPAAPTLECHLKVSKLMSPYHADAGNAAGSPSAAPVSRQTLENERALDEASLRVKLPVGNPT